MKIVGFQANTHQIKALKMYLTLNQVSVALILFNRDQCSNHLEMMKFQTILIPSKKFNAEFSYYAVRQCLPGVLKKKVALKELTHHTVPGIGVPHWEKDVAVISNTNIGIVSITIHVEILVSAYIRRLITTVITPKGRRTIPSHGAIRVLRGRKNTLTQFVNQNASYIIHIPVIRESSTKSLCDVS